MAVSPDINESTAKQLQSALHKLQLHEADIQRQMALVRAEANQWRQVAEERQQKYEQVVRNAQQFEEIIRTRTKEKQQLLQQLEQLKTLYQQWTALQQRMQTRIDEKEEVITALKHQLGQQEERFAAQLLEKAEETLAVKTRMETELLRSAKYADSLNMVHAQRLLEADRDKQTKTKELNKEIERLKKQVQEMQIKLENNKEVNFRELPYANHKAKKIAATEKTPSAVRAKALLFQVPNNKTAQFVKQTDVTVKHAASPKSHPNISAQKLSSPSSNDEDADKHTVIRTKRKH